MAHSQRILYIKLNEIDELNDIIDIKRARHVIRLLHIPNETRGCLGIDRKTQFGKEMVDRRDFFCSLFSVIYINPSFVQIDKVIYT